MTLEDIGGEPEEIAAWRYQIATVPRPHSAFEAYVLQITPQCGLSWIKGIGLTIETSIYGVELRTSFDTLEQKLSATYGRSKRTDLLLRGSIWDEPRDWMQALLRKERYLMTEWSSQCHSTLSNSLVAVFLAAIAMDTKNGYLVVEYSFENKKAAEAEISEAEDAAL
jgi:hypothetical protein